MYKISASSTCTLVGLTRGSSKLSMGRPGVGGECQLVYLLHGQRTLR